MASVPVAASGCAAGRGTARPGRAVGFAASSVSLAWAAHVAGGGERPAGWMTLAAFALLARIAFGLTERERGVGAMVAALGGTQIALHLAFVLAHPHHHAMSGGPSIDPRMAAAHAVAVAAVALLLRRGERILWYAAGLRPRTIARLLLHPAGIDVGPPAAADLAVDAHGPAPRPHTRPLGRDARRRGPPLAWTAGAATG